MRGFFAVSLLIFASPVWAATEIPTPDEVFGHRVGADHKLIPYADVLDYLHTVADASDRVSIEEAGTSTLGNPMEIVVLTSPSNQANPASTFISCKGPITFSVIHWPFRAAIMVCAVPSPPSAAGLTINCRSGRTDNNPSATARHAFGASSEPLKESIATTIFIAYSFEKL